MGGSRPSDPAENKLQAVISHPLWLLSSARAVPLSHRSRSFMFVCVLYTCPSVCVPHSCAVTTEAGGRRPGEGILSSGAEPPHRSLLFPTEPSLQL